MRRPGPFSKNDQVLRLAELDCMDYVVSDVTGPIYPTSKSGKRYIIHFTCVKTGYVCIYFMTTKDQAGIFLTQFLEEIRTIGKTPKMMIIKSDNGGEYIGGLFAEVCRTNNIRRIHSAKFLHEENARAEVVFRDLSNMARAALLTSGLSHEYWPLAYRRAAYIKNRMPSSDRQWVIPYFALRARGYAGFEHCSYFRCYCVRMG